MFCPKCGTKLSDDSAFCSEFGAQIGVTGVESSMPNPSNASPSTSVNASEVAQSCVAVVYPHV